MLHFGEHQSSLPTTDFEPDWATVKASHQGSQTTEGSLSVLGAISLLEEDHWAEESQAPSPYWSYLELEAQHYGGGAPQGRREGLFSLVAWICAGRLQGRALISTNRFLILGLHPRTHTHTHIYKSHIDTTCLCPPSWTRDNLLSLILKIGLDHKLRNHLLMETTLT